jgi:hypothetical protein
MVALPYDSMRKRYKKLKNMMQKKGLMFYHKPSLLFALY